MIQLEDISKTYPGQESKPVVKNLSLRVRPGELMALLGESGCGKTTTLKMINRLVEPTSGSVFVNGRNVLDEDAVQLRRHIGYVFQEIGLFPHMDIAANVSVVPRLLKWPAERIEKTVNELLEMVDLPASQYRHRYPAQLSGGQQQRVGVIRALAGRPGVVLMDEPFGALDPVTRGNLQEEYTRLHRSFDLTTLMVTHDVTEALILADRIAVMKEGQLVQVGSPAELLNRPAGDYVEELMETPRKHLSRLEELAEDSGNGAG